MGWLVAFLYLVCGALRLARFNVQKTSVDGRYFVGLPIPAAFVHPCRIVGDHPREKIGTIDVCRRASVGDGARCNQFVDGGTGG